MTQTKLDRLRARGVVHIEADADGYGVSWWPKGQTGNPFCGRGASGLALDPLVDQLEEATRPPWYADVDSVRDARERKAEYDRQSRQRLALSLIDREDCRREKRARESEAWRVKRRIEIERRERTRVKRVLGG